MSRPQEQHFMARHSQTRQARRQALRRQQQIQARRQKQGPFNWSFIAGAVVVVAAIAIFAAAATGVFKGSSSTANGATGPAATATAEAQFIGNGPTINGIGCDQGMTAGSPHIHADVAVYVRGVLRPLNANVGHDYNDDCLFWVHSHGDAAYGVVHMESPHPIHPTLATYNKIALRSVSKNAEIQLTPKAGEQQRVYVNDKLYHGDISRLPLQNHLSITIEYGPPWVKPHLFNFAAHQL
jgi:hypothetical protein